MQPGAPAPRMYGLALLPLALVGLMPLWQVAGVCALYALGVRSAEWASGRLLLSLLVVSLGFVVAGSAAFSSGPEPLLRVALTFLLHLGAVAALHLGASRIENGGRAGLLVPLGLGLLAPQPLLLAALAGGALARPGADDRGVAQRVDAGAPARRWGLLTLAALTLGALLLPQGGSLWAGWLKPSAQSVRAGPLAPQSMDPAPPQDSPLLDPVRAAPEIRLPFQLGGEAPALPMELFLLVGLALVAALGALQWRLTQRAGRKATLVERLMVLGLALTAVASLVASVLLSGRSGSGAGAVQPDGSPVSLSGTALQNLLGRFTADRIIDIGPPFTALMILSLLLLVGLVAVAWRLARDLRPPVTALPGAEAATGTHAPVAPLHRVRRAWQEAEATLRAAGQGRADSETPAGYAVRLGLQFPVLAGPLQRLSAAYQPVRYGGQITDDDADAAEAALADLRLQSAALRATDSPDPEGHP